MSDWIDGDKVHGNKISGDKINVGNITGSSGVSIGSGSKTSASCRHLNLVAVGQKTYCVDCERQVAVVIVD